MPPAPPKPWEQTGGSSGPTPFRPPTAGKTSEVVESSGAAKPGEVVTNTERNLSQTNAVGRPLPRRPWESNYGNNNYCNSYGGSGYGTGMNYNSAYGSGTYGSYGGYGSSFGGGLYNNNNSMYRSPMYGGGMYSGGYGAPLGNYGMGGAMAPYGPEDPNNPFGPPSSPPGFWISLLKGMHGVVSFFSRIAMLVDQNTQAFHLFMTALLQLFDRSGMLYGELARFVMRVLGIKTKPRARAAGEPGGVLGSDDQGPKSAGNPWDNVWGPDPQKGL